MLKQKFGDDASHTCFLLKLAINPSEVLVLVACHHKSFFVSSHRCLVTCLSCLHQWHFMNFAVNNPMLLLRLINLPLLFKSQKTFVPVTWNYCEIVLYHYHLLISNKTLMTEVF